MLIKLPLHCNCGHAFLAFTDQRFVPGMQPTRNKVRNHLRGAWAPVQHCQAWLHSAIQAACQPGTGGSFPCSSTIMDSTHYHRNEVVGAQIRMSVQSPTSFPTTNTNYVSKWKKDPKKSTTESIPYPNLLPHPMRRSTLCSESGHRFAETSRCTSTEISASADGTN